MVPKHVAFVPGNKWGLAPFILSIVICHHYGIPGTLPGADSASVAFFCNDPVNGIYLREFHAFDHFNTTDGTKIRADSTTRAALLVNHGFGPRPSLFYIGFVIHQEIIPLLSILW
jgi:hypothetical protein